MVLRCPTLPAMRWIRPRCLRRNRIANRNKLASSATRSRMIASARIARVAPGSAPRRRRVFLRRSSSPALYRVLGTSKTHQNRLLCGGVTLLSISLAWVDRMLVVDTTTHGIFLGDLIAHVDALQKMRQWKKQREKKINEGGKLINEKDA